MMVWKWLRSRRRRNTVLVISALMWLAVFALAHTRLFYSFEWEWLNRRFAEDFWPNFLADIGVGLLLAWLLGEVLDTAGHYDLRLEMREVYMLDLNTHAYRKIDIHLINSGQESFKSNEIKYHIYIDTAIIRDPPPGSIYAILPRGIAQYAYFEGQIPDPIYPDENFRPLDLAGFILKRKATSDNPFIYYFFSTAHGPIPNTLKLNAKWGDLRAAMRALPIDSPPEIQP